MASTSRNQQSSDDESELFFSYTEENQQSSDDESELFFSYTELQQATKFFSRELPDGRMVAVKVLDPGHQTRFEQFFREVDTLSSCRHKNLVRLYGSTEPGYTELLLVYEFVPNGTVADHLPGGILASETLPWNLRLRIAIQTAEALAYLHALQPPIVHRDIKTNNILLDENFEAKVADLGLRRVLPANSSHVTTAVQGTPGYIDPDYSLRFKLSVKSDVYNFGVVLLELISGKPAIDKNGDLDTTYLIRRAMKMIRNNQLEKLVDEELGYLTDGEIRRMVEQVAEVARKCLQPTGSMRPTMIEVLAELKDIGVRIALKPRTARLKGMLNYISEQIVDEFLAMLKDMLNIISEGALNVLRAVMEISHGETLSEILAAIDI